MIQIKNCFDSHVHFMATGQVDMGLKLHELKSAEDVKSLLILPEYFKKNWLVGFGWDQHRWHTQQMPDKSVLDQVFPDTPVFFSRVDGHASWINSCGIRELEKLGYDFTKPIEGGKILSRTEENHYKIDNQSVGQQSGSVKRLYKEHIFLESIDDQISSKFIDQLQGILIDQAHIKALLMLPDFTKEQLKKQALKSIEIFNQGGFSHVRDLSSTSTTVEILNELEVEKKLSIYYEGFITAENKADLDRAYTDYQKCLDINRSLKIRMKGLKIFVDGSLGSKTAYLSQPYSGTDDKGLMSWTSEDIGFAIKYCWERKIEIAVHVIGDESAHQVVGQARIVSAQGFLGRIHLEHTQILRPETIGQMKSLHVTCHMQPTHWLSDKVWLKQAIPDLYKNIFPWGALTKNHIHLQFGSDSPIERSCLLDNYRAVLDAQQSKIASPLKEWSTYHAHPDSEWGHCKTIVDLEKHIVSLKMQ